MIDFTPTQQQAIEQFDQNICVSAGAGSGKTSVLVERFLQLVVHKQVSPRRILAMTYTEKAANELKKRLVSEFEARGLIEPRKS
jgi:ATP-dependent exoDNAse (exonuclease V) beta subunit